MCYVCASVTWCFLFLLYSDPHSFIEPEWFSQEQHQPFCIFIDPIVPVLMDMHAHLAHTEVIGLLGGCFNMEKKELYITSIYACQSLPTGADHTNVEMAPESQVEISELIASQTYKHADGQTYSCRVVGWYHSHPYFRNDPSHIDVHNQMKFQKLFSQSNLSQQATAKTSNVPFVAAIISKFLSKIPCDISPNFTFCSSFLIVVSIHCLCLSFFFFLFR